ncbi:MAG: Holliday junction resolvase RuvX [Patescibacteria group bacterium]
MGKYLGIDYGNKHVGIAISNEEKNFVLPREGVATKEIFDYLKNIVEDEAIEKIIVGLPIGLNGQETAQTKKTREFIEQLNCRLSVEIVTEDERLTTGAANRLLVGLDKKSKKKKIDQSAAALILQDYLTKNA